MCLNGLPLFQYDKFLLIITVAEQAALFATARTSNVRNYRFQEILQTSGFPISGRKAVYTYDAHNLYTVPFAVENIKH